MQIISFILLAVLALSMVMVSIFFVYVISKNMQQGRIFRRKLALSLQQLRMCKIIHALGLDFDVYLHTSTVQNINHNMSQCKNCSSTQACDEKLSQQSIELKEIEFCPVHASFPG